ncbi:hypothetical protein ACFQZ4_35880 [Catellatospora coxensis]
MTSLPPGPPKPKSPLRKILIIVAIVLVLCCGGAVVAGYFAYRGIDAATAPARRPPRRTPTIWSPVTTRARTRSSAVAPGS